MSHLYIFDYVDCQIYHKEISDDMQSEEIEAEIDNSGLRSKDCHYLVTEHERSIINL